MSNQNLTVEEQALLGATGKDHGGGGRYFTPGEHLVVVRDVKFFQSQEKKARQTFLVEGRIVESKGGPINHGEIAPGVCGFLSNPPIAEPMDTGMPTTWMQHKDLEVFESRVGNFCTTVKKTHARVWAGMTAEQRTKGVALFTAESPRQGPDTAAEIRTFFDSCESHPNTTQGMDLVHIYRHGLAKDLVLVARCFTTLKKDKTKVIDDVVWDVLTEDRDTAELQSRAAAL